MNETLSPAVCRAVEYALAQGSQYTTRDLLIGLLEEEGRVWELFERHGMVPGLIREKLHRQAGESFLRGGDIVARESLRGDGDNLTSDLLAHHLIACDAALDCFLRDIGGGYEALLREIAPEADLPADDLDIALPEPVATDHSGRMAVARVIDANANRVREALRVIDDYCRFAIDDAYLTNAVKSLRHRFNEALAEMVPAHLIAARETGQDVGTGLEGAGEYARDGMAEVAMVNCKRLQESLRSIEEFAKVDYPQLARAAERFRYESYTLEKALATRNRHADLLAEVRLYVLLSGSQCEASLDWTIREAADGGAGAFQLREKGLNDSELLQRAKEVRRWTRETETLLIVNDRADIARLAEADGVHLGQDDLSVKAARTILGLDAIVGVSAHTLEQVRQAVRDGADYIGVGPTFPSSTKSFDDFPGLDFVRQAAAETSLPTFVIGGVTADNARSVAAHGGRRVAVGAAIAKAAEPRRAAQDILLKLRVDS